ncbi:hypothetical protein ABMA09_22640 [Erwinia rhapontici]|uniref:hypothetical protein n=1 Tax=Erwinia rhapontici TaxID=55212 RepID=UPI003D365241
MDIAFLMPTGIVKMELNDNALKIKKSSLSNIKIGFPYACVNEYEILVLDEELSFITHKNNN